MPHGRTYSHMMREDAEHNQQIFTYLLMGEIGKNFMQQQIGGVCGLNACVPATRFIKLLSPST